MASPMSEISQPTFMTIKPKHAQRGASLIEVLVSALILSLGMLALVGVQVSTSQVSKITQFRGDAQRLGQDMADRIQANFHVQRDVTTNNPVEPIPTFTLTTAYNGNDTALPVPDCATTTCTAAALAAMDVAEMRNLARLILPRGDIRIVEQDIALNQTRAYNVWVLWLPARNSGDVSATEQTQLAGVGCPTALTVAAGTQCLLTRIELRT
jgi:type IV pilus assembly protein PilV